MAAGPFRGIPCVRIVLNDTCTMPVDFMLPADQDNPRASENRRCDMTSVFKVVEINSRLQASVILQLLISGVTVSCGRMRPIGMGTLSRHR